MILFLVNIWLVRGAGAIKDEESLEKVLTTALRITILAIFELWVELLIIFN